MSDAPMELLGLNKRVLDMTGQYRTYLGRPTTFTTLSTSSKKDRQKRKLHRQNRKKGRR